MPLAFRSILRRRPAPHRPPHPATEHDRLVAMHLARALERAFPNAQSLQFLVHHGTVILQGSVIDTATHGKVIEVVSRVPGVRRVIDRTTTTTVLHRLPTAA